MSTHRKHGTAPILILVPAVAGMYLAAGCALPDSPAATGTTSTTTLSTPPTTASIPTSTAWTAMRTLSTPTTTVAPATIEPVADDYAAVCADAVSGVRVDDTECDDATETYVGDDATAAEYAAAGLAGGAVGAAMWYYYTTRNRVVAPAIGARVAGGSYATPLPSLARTPAIYRSGSIDPSGGAITSSTIHRGGLGHRDHSGS
ncbi:hypothetical protein [Nocardia nova]|nr:hypothetical protein [Nocardia nova]